MTQGESPARAGQRRALKTVTHSGEALPVPGNGAP